MPTGCSFGWTEYNHNSVFLISCSFFTSPGWCLRLFPNHVQRSGSKIFLWFQIFTQIVYNGAPTSETYEYELFGNKDSGNSQNRVRLLKWDLPSLKEITLSRKTLETHKQVMTKYQRYPVIQQKLESHGRLSITVLKWNEVDNILIINSSLQICETTALHGILLHWS